MPTALRTNADVQVFTEDEIPQGSEAWRTLRLGVLTGSRCSPVMVEKRPSATRDTLLLQLVVERTTGKSPKSDYQNGVMEQGIEREPTALRYAEADLVDLVHRVGFVYWVGKHTGCSPDGVLGDFDEIISVKCRDLKAHYEHLRRGVIPADARRQMAHELWITGAQAAHYVSYNPDFEPALRYKRVRLTRAELEVDAYATAVEAFLREVEVEVSMMQQLASESPWADALKASSK